MSDTFWDQRYANASYVYGTQPNDFLVSMAGRIPRGPVLCLAEGEGRNAVFLAERGHAVTAVDGSAVGLRKAQELAASRGVSLVTQVADLADFAITPGAWAGIVSIWAHLPPALRQRVHRQVVAGLQPGGVFILEAYTPAQLRHGTGGPKDPSLCMTLPALRAELTGLTFHVGCEIERDVKEGVGHTGLAAVVQVCAHRPAAGGPR
ncbi:class I SAM-dependent methyltransferase [Opitutus sp. ER46]|uniref:class I SAM-dependent methyltransferase n=1 Tax=Opitutus sp. ER46 TaxID=2161864 RepID=UPI000D3272F0|nr:class I SAM-dependent methyltransferase [Opitutus sp. ER46]PTX91484.1 SAM-dependent methyltransferase [Opitutus sp. ER46]